MAAAGQIVAWHFTEVHANDTDLTPTGGGDQSGAVRRAAASFKHWNSAPTGAAATPATVARAQSLIGSRTGKGSKGQAAPLSGLHLLLQPNRDEQQVRHITGIGRRLDRVEQVLRQTLRDRLR